MDKRWIAIFLVVVACGDDSDTSSGTTNNTTSTNNTTNNSTLGTNNSTDGQTSNSNTSTNNSTNNTSTNNTANNVSSSNNATNNDTTPVNNMTTGGATCMEILQCLLVCNTGDELCIQTCKESGSADAQVKIDAYLMCVDTLCADATGVTELTECVLDQCGEEQDACLE